MKKEFMFILILVIPFFLNPNASMVSATGEDNVDSFNVHPQYRWTVAENGTVTTEVEDSLLILNSSTVNNGSLLSRRLQTTKGKLEGKFLSSDDAKTNFGLLSESPTTISDSSITYVSSSFETGDWFNYVNDYGYTETWRAYSDNGTYYLPSRTDVDKRSGTYSVRNYQEIHVDCWIKEPIPVTVNDFQYTVWTKFTTSGDHGEYFDLYFASKDSGDSHGLVIERINSNSWKQTITQDGAGANYTAYYNAHDMNSNWFGVRFIVKNNKWSVYNNYNSSWNLIVSDLVWDDGALKNPTPRPTHEIICYMDDPEFIANPGIAWDEEEGVSINIDDGKVFVSFVDSDGVTVTSDEYNCGTSDWLILKIDYNVRMSDYEFTVEFLNGTEIFEIDLFDISDEIPSISDQSQFFVYFSYTNLADSSLKIDYIKAPFKEQEFVETFEQYKEEIQIDYLGLFCDKDLSTKTVYRRYTLDMPNFDSCSGGVTITTKNSTAARFYSNFEFEVKAVYPTNGTLIDLNSKFQLFFNGLALPNELYLNTEWDSRSYVLATNIDNITVETAFSYYYDKPSETLSLTVSALNYMLRYSYEFTDWVPTEFVALINYTCANNYAITAGQNSLAIVLNDWSLKTRDFLDWIPRIPIIADIADGITGVVGGAIDFVGQLLTPLIRFLNTIFAVALVPIAAILALLESVIRPAIDAVTSAVGGIAGEVWSQFSSILNEISTLVDDAITAIADVAVDFLAGLVSTLVTGMGDLWDEFVDVAGPAIGTFIQYIIDGTQVLLGEIFDFLSDAVDYILEAVFPTDIYDWIISFNNIDWDQVITTIVNFWNIVTSLITVVWILLTGYIFTMPWFANDFEAGPSVRDMLRNMTNMKGVTVLGFYIGLPVIVYWIALGIVLGRWSWIIPYNPFA